MPGTIVFKPIEANLNLGKDLLSKADPYCQFSVGGQQIKGQVCKSGGKHPVWEDSITIPASNQPTCLVELKDKDLLKDDKLGSFEIDLREIESQGRLKKWYPIYHKNKPAGEILMEAVYAPQGGLSQGQGFTGMPTQIIQSQTIPVQPITQTYGVPVGTIEGMSHVQSGATAIQIDQAPIVHHALEISGPSMVGTETIKQTRAISTNETPFQVPNASTQTVKTIKETVILPGVQTQSVFVGAQPQVAPVNLTDTALLNPIMTESLSEQYAREALIRGLDPLGTQIYQYPVGPMNQSLGGQNLPGQSGLIGSHLPGQYGQNLPGVPGQTLVGQYVPNQNPQPGLPVATHMLESNRF